MKKDLSTDALRDLVSYDPESGHFHLRRPSGIRFGAGHQLGVTPNKDGYAWIGVLGGYYLGHRLAWFYVHGEWPNGQIDHINGVRDDNRIANLRVVTPMVNSQNQRVATRRNLSCGLLGVTLHKGGRWQARITVERKARYLGLFDSAEDAHAAYVQAKRRLHEGNTI